MSYKARALDLRQREKRQQNYTSAATIGARFPAVRELSLEVRFTQAEGKPLLSPYRQIYFADMQAFFQLPCPSRDCSGGGFDLDSAMASAAGSDEGGCHGTLRCRGTTLGSACPVEMVFSIQVAAD